MLKKAEEEMSMLRREKKDIKKDQSQTSQDGKFSILDENSDLLWGL